MKLLVEAAKQQFIEYGAHEVIEDMSQLPGLIETINSRLLGGDSPHGY